MVHLRHTLTRDQNSTLLFATTRCFIKNRAINNIFDDTVAHRRDLLTILKFSHVETPLSLSLLSPSSYFNPLAKNREKSRRLYRLIRQARFPPRDFYDFTTAICILRLFEPAISLVPRVGP